MEGPTKFVIAGFFLMVLQGCVQKKDCLEFIDLNEQKIDTNKLNQDLLCISGQDTLVLENDIFNYAEDDSSVSSISNFHECTVGISYVYYLNFPDAKKLRLSFSYLSNPTNLSDENNSEASYTYWFNVEKNNFEFESKLHGNIDTVFFIQQEKNHEIFIDEIQIVDGYLNSIIDTTGRKWQVVYPVVNGIGVNE